MPLTPPISVVIPCHNAARYVCSTVRSVLAQEGFELEVLVVDDGSTDGSAEVVEQEFPSVVLLRQPNRGVAAARNAGIERASHDWIAFVDADDLWLPGKIRAQWELLGQHPGARMVYTAWQEWASTELVPDQKEVAGLLRSAESSRWDGPSGWLYSHLLLESVVWTSTVLLHRSVLEEVGMFDPALRVGEDLDLWLRASRVTPILRVCAPLALYRMHSSSLTKRVPAKNYRAELVYRALRTWGYASPDGARAQKSDVRRVLSRSWWEYGAALVEGGRAGEAVAAGIKALLADPTQPLAWKVTGKALASFASSRLHVTRQN